MPIHQTKRGYSVRSEFRHTVRDRDEAERLHSLLESGFARIRRDFLCGLSSTIGIREGIEPYCRHQRSARGTKIARIVTIRKVLDRWADVLSRNAGDIPLDKITHHDIDAAIDARLSQKGYRKHTIARSTMGKEVGILKSYAIWASGPARRAPRDMDVLSYRFASPRDMHHGGEVNSMPMAEFLRHANHIAQQSRQAAAVLFGMVYFGLRPEALVSLRWERVHLPAGDHGCIRPRTLKHGDPTEVSVPAGSLRRALLEECASMFRAFGHRGGRSPVKSDPVFPTLRGRSRRNKYGWTVDTFDKEIRRLAEKLRLPTNFVAYVGRHSAITALQHADGVGVGHVARYAKHRRLDTQNAYAHGREAEPAFAAIERLTRKAFAQFKASQEGLPPAPAIGDCEDELDDADLLLI